MAKIVIENLVFYKIDEVTGNEINKRPMTTDEAKAWFEYFVQEAMFTDEWNSKVFEWINEITDEEQDCINYDVKYEENPHPKIGLPTLFECS